MHVGVRVGIVVTVAVAVISIGIFLCYSIQVGVDIRWLYRMAAALGVAGLVFGVRAWAQSRKNARELDDIKCRLAIREFVREDERLLRSVFPGDDR